jgi:hypothetical protein
MAAGRSTTNTIQVGLSTRSLKDSPIDFGDVGVGGTRGDTVLTSNVGDSELSVNAITLSGENAAAFAIGNPLLTVLGPGDSIVVEITFAPTEAGRASGQVQIDSTDPDHSSIIVSLTGNGLSFAEQIDNLVVALDTGVLQGDLQGSGPGESAAERLDALRNMLVQAGELINEERYADACLQLADALSRCDGDTPPPDFVIGNAASGLAAAIISTRSNIGCE